MTSALPNGEFGPLLRGGRVRRGGPDWRRLSAIVLGTAGLVLAVVGITAGAAIWYGTANIERVDVPDLAVPGDVDGDGEPEEEIEEITDVLNVLVVGSDSREGLTDEQLLALGTEPEDGLRTDTIMLLQLDPRRDQVIILSFPRDLLVTRCDGSRGRINAAYGVGETSGVGGPTCLVRTITDFTGIPINHFIQVDFAGFIDIVDSLGGVTIYLDEPIRDAHAGVDLPAGCVEMDGTTSLGFVRVRRIDNDFGRIARQQRFIREVVREAASVGTLVNVPRLFSLVDAGAKAVETDRQLSLAHMRRIAFSLRDLGPESIDTRTIPATPRTINGAAFVVAHEEQAEALFRAFREGALVPDGVGLSEPAPIGIADVPPVVVLNGAGIAGLAQEALAQLEAQGFSVAETGNADSYDFRQTQVVYPEGMLEEAELLSESLDGAALVPGEQGEPLTVVLGADYTPLDPDDIPTPEPTPTDAPEASPTPSFVGAEPGREC
jgi:LCP family protein required for cell wall assembly